MLVEKYLLAVVSLPGGVFNPYSGVKTSILILDKNLARRTDRIAFFKVDADGYDLGAQRRAVDRNDLPHAQAELTEYLGHLRAGGSPEEFTPETGLIVEKDRVAADGDYNLSGERYRENYARQTIFPKFRLGDLLTLEFGTRITKRDNSGTLYPVYGGGGESFRTDTFTREDDVVISRFAISPECVREVIGKFYLLDSGFTFSITDHFKDRASKQFITYTLLNIQDAIYNCSRGHAQKNIDFKSFNKLEIPLPPLEVQQEIAAEIEGYKRVIDGARAVVENYRPHIEVDPGWPVMGLGEVCSIGGTITKNINHILPYIGADSIESQSGKLLKIRTAQEQGVNGPVYAFTGERLLYSKIRPYLNKLTIVDFDGYCSSDMYPLQPDQTKINIVYFATYLLSNKFNDSIRFFYERASIPKINRSQLFQVGIPVPPLETQKSVVAEIRAEQALVEANRELIGRMEKKIQAAIGRVWGEDATLTNKDGRAESSKPGKSGVLSEQIQSKTGR